MSTEKKLRALHALEDLEPLFKIFDANDNGFDAILTREVITREKLQFLYENVMSNNFRRTVVLNIYIYIYYGKIETQSSYIYIYIYIHCKLKLHS